MNEAKIEMNKVKKEWMGCKRNELGKKRMNEKGECILYPESKSR